MSLQFMLASLKHALRQHFWGFRPFKRHGIVLMVAGTFYMLTGVVYILTTPTASRNVALQVALDFAPIEFWGGVFVLMGLLAFISSRWPPVTDTWGYMVLAALSAGWSATYTWGVIFENAPTGNLSATLQWGLLAFLWWAVPGFVEPDKTVVVVINDEGTGN